MYYKSFNDLPVNDRVLTRYEAQKRRGQKGFGFYMPQINRLTHNVREERILELLKAKPASEILYHHRFPTSTENVRNACHPFSTHKFFRHNYVMVHNGVIRNYTDLSIAHQTRGIHYVSVQEDGKFNDSEALLYDLALYLEGEQTELKAQGRTAFIVIEHNGHGKPSKLHFGRNALSPLFLSYTKDQISLASEASVANAATEVMPDMLYTYVYRTGQLTLKPLPIPEPVYAYNPPIKTKRGKKWERKWGQAGRSSGAVSPAEATSYHQADISPGASGIRNPIGSASAYTPGSPADIASKQPMGFKTDHLTPSRTPLLDQDDTYWNSGTQAWVEDIYLTTGSDSYWDMVHKRGYHAAYDYLSEYNELTLAVEGVNNSMDSAMGKLERLKLKIDSDEIKKEKKRWWIQQDILEFALDVLKGLDRDEVLYGLTDGNKDLALLESGENLDRSS